MTRILIADDHDVVRSGLRAALEPRWQIICEVADGKGAIRKACEFRPDIAIVDYSLPLINGLEVTRQIKARVPGVKVLIFTMHDSEEVIHDVLQAGARGYVLKSDGGSELIKAVEALEDNRPFFTARVSATLLENFLARSVATNAVLTARERSIVQLVAEGHSNKEIASILSVSHKTVEAHRATAMHKLDLGSTAALVRYALRNRIIQD